MKVYKLGLTGSIGMGKSTTASMFADAGVPVFDSDAIVHDLYAKDGGAVAPLESVFPEAIENGAVSRLRLSALLAQDPSRFEVLNRIVHPLVSERREAFLEKAAQAGHDLVVFDIPLLFETGGDGLVDGVLVVTAPEGIQRERVLARPGMTEKKFDYILSQQTPDAEKRARADFLIDTSKGLEFAQKAVEELIGKLKKSANQPSKNADA
ncbi:dephospho-CoA kinase [Hyphobacterium sp.]|uniref:dephospho-CoA kinase n=1 Tax=Hyphobacterium sp. TaxID=2004662 RepID=UPI003BA96240